MTPCPCRFCQRALEPVQEFRFLVETATLGEPAHLARIRRLPAAEDGTPLRVCRQCQHALETHPARFLAAVERPPARRDIRTGVVATFGLLSFGWFLATMLGPPRS